MSLPPRAVGLVLVLSITVGGCNLDPPASISFDGQEYQFQRPGRYLTLTEADFSEIGEASRVNHPYVEGRTVYAIRGIDPATAVAMRSATEAADDRGPMGEFIVLYVGDYPEELCQYEIANAVQPAEECFAD